MKTLVEHLRREAERERSAGLARTPLTIDFGHGANIIHEGRQLLNLASNDYLGFANRPTAKAEVKQAIERWGFGIAAPRFLAGTQPLHRRLEERLTGLLRSEDTLLFASGYHANLGVFESLFDERDTLLCDQSSHSSLADGAQLCGAQTTSFDGTRLSDLEDKLQRSRSSRFRAIVTDTVSSLSGALADLPRITQLARAHDAVVIVDDSHGVGVLGQAGAGTAEHLGVRDGVDLITGSLSHAIGAGAGGFVSGRGEIVGWLRQKARSYLASTALSPAAVTAALHALDLLGKEPTHLERLRRNTQTFRDALTQAGLRVRASEHPMVVIDVGDTKATQRVANTLFEKGIYATGFSHPILPQGDGRIRAQLSAVHTSQNVNHAIDVMTAAVQGALS